MLACKSLMYPLEKKPGGISKTVVENIFGKLPQGSEIKEFTPDYCIFITDENKTEGLGFQTIRFKVEVCYLRGGPNDEWDSGCAYSPTEWTLAMRHHDKIVITEGRHRAIHVFQGGTVSPSLGGVLEKPNILEYTFDPATDAPHDSFFDKIVPVSNFSKYINPYNY